MAGLYRGISAPLVGAALETSSLFFWERLAREGLFWTGNYERSQSLPLSALWLTGSISGAFTSLVLTPVELVKCKIQSPLLASKNVFGCVPQTPLGVIKEVLQHQGISGFWHGQMGTLIRETGGGAAWFGTKESVSNAFHRLNLQKKQVQGLEYKHQISLPLWQQALAGAAAGMMYNFLFFLSVTVKSRTQTASTTHKGPKITFWNEGANLYRQHGVRGFYRGCGITVLRSAPSSAFIFMIFDGLKNHTHL